MSTIMTSNCLGFGMLTVETAVFDCIGWLVPVMSDTSVFIWSNIVWNRLKNTLKARSKSEPECRNRNVNIVYFIHSNQSHGGCIR